MTSNKPKNNTNKPVKAKKKFGQNFLQDHNLINNIILSFNIKPDDLVLEIGPGLGAITTPLLERLNHLHLVEIDRELAERLKNKYNNKITLFNTDILNFDLEKSGILDTNPATSQKIKIIGNLPYNISTPILFHLFKYIDSIDYMLFMLQLEVVERIVASPGNKQYGRLSIMTQLFCDAEQLFTIPPTAFNPMPKVQSAMVMLTLNKNRYLSKLKNLNLFDTIVQAAFSMRRKTISNSLKNHLSSEDLTKLNIDPKLRAENLSINDFITITNHLTS